MSVDVCCPTHAPRPFCFDTLLLRFVPNESNTVTLGPVLWVPEFSRSRLSRWSSFGTDRRISPNRNLQLRSLWFMTLIKLKSSSVIGRRNSLREELFRWRYKESKVLGQWLFRILAYNRNVSNDSTKAKSYDIVMNWPRMYLILLLDGSK